MSIDSIDERVWASCCVWVRAHKGLTGGFILLCNSVVCTLGPYLCFISFFSRFFVLGDNTKF